MSTSPYTIGYLGLNLSPNLSLSTSKNHKSFGSIEDDNHKRRAVNAELVEDILKSNVSALFVDPEDTGEIVWMSTTSSKTPRIIGNYVGEESNSQTTLSCITFSQKMRDKYHGRVLGLLAECILIEGGDIDNLTHTNPIIQSRKDIELNMIYSHLKCQALLFPINSPIISKIRIWHAILDPVNKWGWDQEKFENGMLL